jgi:hypothetical protein
MKTSWITASMVAATCALAIACSSSSGSSYSGTNCPSEGVTNSSCVSCIQSSCSSQLSSLNSGCNASDFNCACPSGANPSECTLSSSCQSAGPAYQSCVESSCSSSCGAISGSSSGGSGSGSGSGSSSGGSPSSCAVGSGASPACATCLQTNCCASLGACDANPDCSSFGNCIAACQTNTCTDNCTTQYETGASLYNAFFSCNTTNCASACGT